MYIICQESHYVGALDSSLEPRIKVEKSRARNPAPPPLKGFKLTEEKALILTTKTAFIDKTLKFSRMRWTISRRMVSQSLNDT